MIKRNLQIIELENGWVVTEQAAGKQLAFLNLSLLTDYIEEYYSSNSDTLEDCELKAQEA